VSVVDDPAQIVEDETLTFILGVAFTVIKADALALHPLEFVPVTEYVVVTLGLTVILAEVDPVLHK
jgi:hypothetical protein